MAKRALIIGINEYDKVNDLSSCVADAEDMAKVLRKQYDGSPNFDCQVMTKPGPGKRITRVVLRDRWVNLFDFDGDVLFYFSGHGCSKETGAFLVTQEGIPGDPGLPMNDLLTIANASKVKSALFILDCCFSGDLGNPPNLQAPYGLEQAQLRRGVTILAASGPREPAIELGQHSIFTDLILGALNGGAADVRGCVSAASIYAYVEAALGPWDQRPLYKTHASCLPPVRQCEPSVSDSLLRELPDIFKKSESKIVMDPSYEVTHKLAQTEKVSMFNKFKKLRDARLLQTETGNDLYWTALESKAVQLTPLGQFYRRLAKIRRI